MPKESSAKPKPTRREALLAFLAKQRDVIARMPQNQWVDGYGQALDNMETVVKAVMT